MGRKGISPEERAAIEAAAAKMAALGPKHADELPEATRRLLREFFAGELASRPAADDETPHPDS